jgi:hypothetical protein
MSAHHAEDGDNLPPEMLAAYADGELTPDECRRVEAWLAAHPEARADAEDQRRLARLFDEAAPPPPSDERWAEAMARVCDRLAVPPPAPSRRRRRAAVAILAVAAALLGGLLLKPRQDEEMWSVVSPDDVEILSMDDRDRGALVVGEPPVNEPMELLTEDEVRVDKLPGGQGRNGRLHVLPGPGAPYVMVSVGGADPDSDP